MTEEEIIKQMKKQGFNKKKRVPTYNMSMAQLQALESKNRNEAIKLAFHTFILFSYMYLRDEEGYGAKRMERFIDYIEHMQCLYNDGQFKLYDIMKQLEEETGIKIKEDDPIIRRMISKC